MCIIQCNPWCLHKYIHKTYYNFKKICCEYNFMIIIGPQSSCQFLMWVTTMSIGCHIKTLCPNNCGWYSLSTNGHCWLSLLWHKGSGKKLATHLHPMPRLRMCGTMPPLHIHLHSVVLNKSQGNFTLLLQKGITFYIANKHVLMC